MKQFFLAIFVGILVFFSVNILLIKSPFVWPDEATYANVAQNFLKEGRMGVDLWKGIVPGASECLCWYPPTMFYILAPWFKIFGSSIENQRFLSVTMGVGVIITFYFITKLFLPKEKSKSKIVLALPSIMTGVIATDYIFSRASRLSRPEIFVLFFGLISVLFFLKSLENTGKKSADKLMFVAGIAAGLSFTSHFLGAFFIAGLTIYLFIIFRFAIFRKKQFWLLVLSFLIPVVFWVILTIPHLGILKEQAPLIWARKTEALERVWVFTLFRLKNWPLIIVFTSYFILSLTFLTYSIIAKNKRCLLPAIFLCLSWTSAFYGRMLWYFSLPVPFVYLTATIILINLIHVTSTEKAKFITKLYEVIVIFALAGIMIVNIEIGRDDLLIYSGGRYSYQRLTEAVLKLIPDNKNVFLSSIPDLYFGFKEKGRNNPLYEYPGVTQTKEAYIEYLKNIDFVVYSNAYDFAVFGDFLPSYLEDNQLKSYVIKEPLQNSVYVVELKPKEDRIIPNE